MIAGPHDRSSGQPEDPLRDPLARRRVIPSGPHAARILLVAAAVVGLGLVGYLLTWDDGEPRATVVSRFEQRVPEPKLPTYADLAPREPPPEPPSPRVPLAPTTGPKPAPTKPSAAGPRDSLRAKAMDAGVGGWSRGDRERPEATPAATPVQAAQKAAASSASTFHAPPDGCFVPPGTPIEAQTLNRVATERGGIVAAMTTRDLWGASFACLAVPAGSTLVLEYGTGATKGQKRIEILNPILVRPWPKSDTVQLAAMTADAFGASGLPGRVDVPFFRTGALIAASTAVDLGVAALSGDGGLIGAILGRNVDRPLDKAAKDLLDRAPVITLEAGAPILVFLRGGLVAEDFRNP